jgi:hypothetical protein
MAKAAAAAAPTKSLVKREPVVFISAAVTLISTALYLAPSVGIKVPDKVAKIVSLGLTLASSFGARILVKPA